MLSGDDDDGLIRLKDEDEERVSSSPKRIKLLQKDKQIDISIDGQTDRQINRFYCLDPVGSG